MLKELGIPYKAVAVLLADVKKPEYSAVNPNGCPPAIYDPNTDLTLYEPQNQLPASSPESYEARQFLYFQASDQGPYYGHAAWFKKFHHENLPSALDHYVKEVHRVTGVWEKVLSEKNVFSSQDVPWLVGGKYSVADLASISCQNVISIMFDKTDYNLENYPHVKAWMDRIFARLAF
ncbi:glutathione S-transferase Ure2-like protein [Metarhizium acridum CQMa 102]|uniref:Glutathione S-transferase Ure2-like protein n=1 Tax=Metarhizium acridum (strain CQMa 102) TaxID=655827 RepID=E9E2I7_METAQ|nr:glutathione S-transferase Ure2-like protein [Metarhizium acridum CQMa 102]EFY89876.1 glutathione S-transferase Ure2-like protein [Metarhizium acridum CQMa 102]